MKFKNILFTTLFAAGCLSASAQETMQVVTTEEVFAPHWYLQAQAGLQNTLGEVDWADLNSFNAQLAVGYQITPIWGARFNLNAWQSRAGSDIKGDVYKWKWNYVAPALNVTLDLTNLIGGYKIDRRWNVGVFAGGGLNYAFNNDEAKDCYNTLKAALIAAGMNPATNDQALRYYWKKNKLSLVGQFGANVDYRFNDRWSAGLEFNANTLTDRYNSKKAKNADWYFNYLLGVRVNLGKTHKTQTTVTDIPVFRDTIYIHDTIYVTVEKPVSANANPENIRRDIFFVIASSKVSDSEKNKVQDLVDYLNKYPNAKLNVTGYADKGTGNPTINKGYAQRRAQTVADILVKQFGIDKSRLIVDSKGDTEQPFAENNKNRVTICISE